MLGAYITKKKIVIIFPIFKFFLFVFPLILLLILLFPSSRMRYTRSCFPPLLYISGLRTRFPFFPLIFPVFLEKKENQENSYAKITALRACPNRIEIVNHKSKSIRFRECFGRGVQTESKHENRNTAEKHRRAATYGSFKTMYTCRQSSARQHRSTRAAGIQDENSTPGGR